jgi:probable HAF family extracellular repeat protein
MSTTKTATTYKVTDTGALSGGWLSENDALNSHGQAAGYTSWSSDGTSRPDYYDGKLHEIPRLPNFASGYAHAINDSGVVAGICAGHSSMSWLHRAFFYDGTVHDLGFTPDTWTQAYGINNKGDVVGWADNGSATHAFLYSGGKMTDLGSLVSSNYNSCGKGINDSGQITGFSFVSNSGTHAFLYEKGKMNDLGVPGGATQSYGMAINSKGQVVGYATMNNGNPHAMYFDGGKLIEFAGLPGDDYSMAMGINNKGKIVGGSQKSNGVGPQHAFIWQNGKIEDLNKLTDASGSGWVLVTANAINERGQIAGFGYNGSAYRGFILTPNG